MTTRTEFFAEATAPMAHPQEVREIIGEHDLGVLQWHVNNVRMLEDLQARPNPFKNRQTAADFAFADPATVGAVKEFMGSPSPNQWHLTGAQEFIHSSKYLEHGLKLVVSTSQAYGDKISAASGYIEENLLMEKYGRILESSEDDLWRVDVDDVAADFDKLKEIAESTPTIKSAAPIKNILDTVEREFRIYKARAPQSMGRRSRLGKVADTKFMTGFAGRMQQCREYLDACTDLIRKSDRVGSEYVDLVQGTALPIECANLVMLVEVTSSAKNRISKQYENESSLPAAALEAEAFLLGLMRSSHKRLSQLIPEIKTSDDQQWFLNVAAKAELHDRQQAQREQQEREVAGDLNTALTEARDILIGGRRLGSKKNGVVQKAEAVGKLAVGDKAVFSPEQAGVMIALFTGKFDRFVDTLGEVHASKPSEAMRVVNRNRPEIVQRLRNYDSAKSLQHLYDLWGSGSRTEELQAIFGVEALGRMRERLERHLAIEPPAAVPEIPPETPLTDNELFVELDWTVLPQGETELEKAAREIVANAGPEAVIDLQRLTILRDIKHEWGADRCYYARGQLKGRPKVDINGEDHPDEYIVLVLQNLDRSGKVIHEHAVAESPITRHNALYVLRADVTEEFTWREIFALPKKHARDLGARAVKHTTPKNVPLIETMRKKVAELLSCTPEEFLTMEFDGKKRRFRQYLGYLGIG